MLSNNGRRVFNSREEKRPTSTVGRPQAKGGNDRLASVDKQIRDLVETRNKLAGSSRTVVDPRKQHSSSNGSGPGRPVVSKGVPPKIPGSAGEKKVGIPVQRLPPTSSVRRPVPTSSAQRPVSTSSVQRPVPTSSTQRPFPTSNSQRPVPSKSHPPVSKQMLIRKGESQQSRKPNLLAKQMVPPSRPKVCHTLP